MKVVFLDVDGVLHPVEGTEPCTHDKNGRLEKGHFRDASMEALAQIVHQSDAHIVLSSVWRRTPTKVKALNRVLQKWKIGPVTSFTSTEDIDGSGSARVGQIWRWLGEHLQDVDGYVALDDMDLSKVACQWGLRPSPISKHFVRTRERVGLTNAHVQLAVHKLNAPPRMPTDARAHMDLGDMPRELSTPSPLHFRWQALLKEKTQLTSRGVDKEVQKAQNTNGEVTRWRNQEGQPNSADGERLSKLYSCEEPAYLDEDEDVEESTHVQSERPRLSRSHALPRLMETNTCILRVKKARHGQVEKDHYESTEQICRAKLRSFRAAQQTRGQAELARKRSIHDDKIQQRSGMHTGGIIHPNGLEVGPPRVPQAVPACLLNRFKPKSA